MYNNTCVTQSDKNSILAVSVRIKEKYSRGRRGAPAKGVGRATGARVQIPLSPLYCQRWKHWGFNASFFENPGSENPTKKFVLWYWQILDGMLRYRTLPNLIVILKNEKINFKKCKKVVDKNKAVWYPIKVAADEDGTAPWQMNSNATLNIPIQKGEGDLARPSARMEGIQRDKKEFNTT